MGVAAVVAALACGFVPAAASASDDPCTATGSNLIGGPSRNVFCGTSGNDVLLGNSGDDELRGFDGNDTLDGGSDNDLLNGGSGNDSLTGGIGIDIALGEGGNDRLHLRDGEVDNVVQSCGSGTDSLDMDLADVASLAITGISLLFLACENITVGAIHEGPNVVISGRSLRVGKNGRAAARLRCPSWLDIPCGGSRAHDPDQVEEEATPAAHADSIRAGDSGHVRRCGSPAATESMLGARTTAPMG